MAELPLDQGIPRFKTNEERFHDFVNGSETGTFTTSTDEVVPSIRKFLADKDVEINAGAGSILAQATQKAEDASDSAEAAQQAAQAAQEAAEQASLFDPSSYYTRTQIDANIFTKTQADARFANLSDMTNQLATMTTNIGAVQSNVDSFSTQIAQLQSNVSTFGLMLADQYNQRLNMLGGILDAFDSESGIDKGAANGIDPYTKSLLHFDGNQGKVTIVDDGWEKLNSDLSTAKVWQGRGPAGACFIDTAQSKFGGSSMRFSGQAAGGFFSGKGDPDWAIAANTDFTFECQIRLNATGIIQAIIDSRPTTDSGWALSILANNTLQFFWNNSARINGSAVLTTGVWYHLCLQRSGSNVTLAVNGVQDGSTFVSPAELTLHAAGPFFGTNFQGSLIFNGWLDEVRLSVGIARWPTLPFTPPTAAYGVPIGETQKQIYDLTNGLYRPADLKRNIFTINQNVADVLTQRSYRQMVPSRWIERSGSYFRVRFNMGSGTINNAFVGQKATSGNGWNFAGSPTRITFNGGQSSVTLVAGTPVWSDWISFVVDDTKDHIISADVTSFTSTPYSTLGTDLNAYFKVGALTEAGTIAPTGYTSNVGVAIMFDQIEVKSSPETSDVMVLKSVATIATAVPTKIRLSVQVSGSVALTVNTDIIAYVSRDNGTTWTQVTLVQGFNQGGIRQFDGVADVSAQPAGTSMRWKVTNPTGAYTAVTGIVEAWT